jgi:hypothetical protein
MNTPEAEEISSLVSELDRKVPQQGAVVELKQYGGGPDESKVIANQLGYLRLGIEFLKAAFKQPSEKNPDAIEVDLRYLLSDDSDVGFDQFERREDMKERQIEKTSAIPAVVGCCLAILLLAVVVFAIIGVFSLIKR